MFEGKYIKDNLMYSTSLFFKIKDSAALDKHRILEIFFKSWVDGNCNNEVNYTVQYTTNVHTFEELFRVDFISSEDAMAIKLKGVPKDISDYVELID